MSRQFIDWLDSLTDAEYEALNADQDDGRAAFEDEASIWFLESIGTTDDPRDEFFDDFEGSSEHGLIQSALDLHGIGWSEERIVERVRAGLKAA